MSVLNSGVTNVSLAPKATLTSFLYNLYFCSYAKVQPKPNYTKQVYRRALPSKHAPLFTDVNTG